VFHPAPSPYGIPYRSLYSRNISNLFMAGRDLSATHVALGGVRVMRTCCLMGQAVGTAASIARQHDTTPRGVYQDHLAELQQTLVRDGCYLMGVKNADPNDLALKATVTASSSAEIDDPAAERKLPNGGMIHNLTTSRAVMFTARHDRLDQIELFLRSERNEPTPMEVTLCRARALGDFASGEELATATADVPPRSEGWVTFPLSAKLEPGKVYFAWLPAASGLQWDLYPYFPEGTWRAYGGPSWRPMTHCYKHRLSPGGEPTPPEGWRPPGKIVLAPENVINGWNRAVHGTPNSWGPDPEQPLPQWIELQLPERVRFNAVHISFQTPSMAPADYDLAVPDGDGWRTVLAVEDNSLRRRVHQFDAVEADRLRLTILRARDGGESPRICEIRVYGEE
ncbi:MAG: FAD-dependent oxidoreductase, partial [Armatimonadota bacterium]